MNKRWDNRPDVSGAVAPNAWSIGPDALGLYAHEHTIRTAHTANEIESPMIDSASAMSRTAAQSVASVFHGQSSYEVYGSW